MESQIRMGRAQAEQNQIQMSTNRHLTLRLVCDNAQQRPAKTFGWVWDVEMAQQET